MKHFKFILLLVLVFAAGLVTGVVATRAVVRHVVQETILHPGRAQTFLERSLTRRLRLDNGQQIQLHQILSGAHRQMQGLRREYQPQMFEVISNASGQINAILTPEQQAKFEQMKANVRGFWSAKPAGS